MVSAFSPALCTILGLSTQLFGHQFSHLLVEEFGLISLKVFSDFNILYIHMSEVLENEWETPEGVNFLLLGTKQELDPEC